MFTSTKSQVNGNGPSAVAEPLCVQTKLTVGEPDDMYEQEADAVADSVMRMQDVSASYGSQSAAIQRKCAHCEEKEKAQLKPQLPFIQMKGGSAGTPVSDHVSNRIGFLQGGGSGMAENTRSFMESRFGNDFSQVRIHTDSQAVQLSRELNAQAFTVGSDVFFNEGKYAPESESGKRLLAHELTHTVQQGGASLQRMVLNRNVTCHENGLRNPDMTGAEVVQAIVDADTLAIGLLTTAQNSLQTALDDVIAGNPADPVLNVILTEELGLDLTDASQRGLIRQAIQRIDTVRTTLESGYLRYMCRGGDHVSLVGCLEGSCAGSFAFTCPGNRLIVLCQSFWDQPAERPGTILHETFHIWFHMTHSNRTKRANATCLEGFVRRANGEAGVNFSCAAGAH